MNRGRTVCTQIREHLPAYDFQKCGARSRGDSHLRGCSGLDQYLAMAFAQLTDRESLRDIEACLRSGSGKLYPRGLRGKVSRTTRADANESQDGRSCADFAQVLIAIARPRDAHDPIGVDREQSLYALDSTPIDLCRSLFPWAKFRPHQAAVKMRTLLDRHGHIPTFLRVPSGDGHDGNLLDEILPEAGAFSVRDRAHVEVQRRFVLTLRSAFLVVRTQSNGLLERRSAHAGDKSTGVRSDPTVILAAINSAKAYPDGLRRGSDLDVKTRKRFQSLTHNFTLPALTIAPIYKSRWQLEWFFQWIQQPLRIKAF
jgi:hypothetical protein